MKSKLLVSMIVLLAFALLGSWGYFNSKEKSVKIEASSTSEQEDASNPQVKMSTSGICHEKGTRYYETTKKFRAFMYLDECLSKGGRLPY